MPSKLLSHKEKLAVMHVADEVIHADNKLQLSEMNFMVRIAKKIDFDLAKIRDARSIPNGDAKLTINEMTDAKKSKVKDMLVQLSASDDEMDNSELKLIMDIFL